MKAIDTNILVRLIVGDNPEQFEASAKLFATEQIFICDTVILETEWVLRGVYGLTRSEVCEGFRKLFGLDNVYLSEPELVFQAIGWHEMGLDFADAFHLALSQSYECLKTFDGRFIKRAKKFTECKVEGP